MNAAKAKPLVIPPHLQDLAENLPLTLPLKDAAKVLSMHPHTVQRMIVSGEIHAMRSKLRGASRIIIPRSEIIRWCIEHSAR
jgi:excisionase family DNA binding protein